MNVRRRRRRRRGEKKRRRLITDRISNFLIEHKKLSYIRCACVAVSGSDIIISVSSLSPALFKGKKE